MTTTTEDIASAEALARQIRDREQAATPGPWCWRGNIDSGDPRLTSTGLVTGTSGRAHRGADVLGHIPHEITRDEARRWVSPDYLPEPKVDQLPLDTYDDRYDAAVQAQVEAEVDRKVTDKYGEPEKEWRLAFCTDWLYTEARDLAVFEVAPDAVSRADPRVYRADITGIRHPDAEFIARSRQDVAQLLDAVEGVLRIADHAEREALRWENPLPVPPWVAQVREEIGRRLRPNT